VWPVITRGIQTPCEELLINFDPPVQGFVGQAAMRVGEWTGQPLVPPKGVQRCPDSWVHLNGTIHYGPYTPFTWLFNIKEDPNERYCRPTS